MPDPKPTKLFDEKIAQYYAHMAMPQLRETCEIKDFIHTDSRTRTFLPDPFNAAGS
jgi:hypothetical protein